MPIKDGNKQQCIILDPEDQRMLDYLTLKLGLKPTLVYRLALREYYRKERKVD